MNIVSSSPSLKLFGLARILNSTPAKDAIIDLSSLWVIVALIFSSMGVFCWFF